MALDSPTVKCHLSMLLLELTSLPRDIPSNPGMEAAACDGIGSTRLEVSYRHALLSALAMPMESITKIPEQSSLCFRIAIEKSF